MPNNSLTLINLNNSHIPIFNYVRMEGTTYVNAFEELMTFPSASMIYRYENGIEMTFTSNILPLDFYQDIVREFRGLELYYEIHWDGGSIHGRVGGITFAHNMSMFVYNNREEYETAKEAYDWVRPPFCHEYED